ncbi:hypothetical protein M3M35_05735 [Fructilactobacillus myrtifloralis]|uniref:Thoeris protein ThsB TIR-like domain-containing protein n=1 Tax=Fructilactobacillus myrtifloralis TaxID=2940301 RepID=A0ABY5BQE0_9LACO|nr:hypothetical protein [Fructilactobacillus myrtifloralis]USS84806.1 hypothetical protein M3M35_05735 [Fructilactobacillus myrtifloralis]
MKKRIFISFAIEDEKLRDFIVGQSKNKESPFEFIDMSVKEPWTNSWKTKCNSKIKSCDGVIAFITSKTKSANGELWEIKCSQDNNIPILFVWGYKEHLSYVPGFVNSSKIKNWKWDNIEKWIDKL